MKILLVEDEVNLLNTTSDYLRKEGYLCEEAPSYLAAEDKIATHQYDVVILDLTLPDGNGLDLLHKLKALYPDTGVLIVSARNSLDDRLTGLDLGADDYITKPFFLAELNSRINAIIRRRQFSGNCTVQFNEIEVLPDAMQVKVNGNLLELTKKEYDLLLYFVTNKNRVLTREAIAEHSWGDHADSADNFDYIYSHIKNLRRKIVQAGGTDYLHTVYGVGYKFSSI
ncbi:response regulator transcription factor [Pontibacter mangrovi]|uniref:Response regulator transcription factor n=2 Tax=Pseudomonadati TaxID=3379134 RepID=A0A501WGG8_9RHOB|nr:response regulator transcription factor [Pontibacter mangrovi]TPE41551.1 response regulator transcription factor [Pontibacter mangrovi]TPE48679.1 response regulator transcription factor [Amaricoccus solimangrovi]